MQLGVLVQSYCSPRYGQEACFHAPGRVVEFHQLAFCAGMQVTQARNIIVRLQVERVVLAEQQLHKLFVLLAINRSPPVQALRKNVLRRLSCYHAGEITM